MMNDDDDGWMMMMIMVMPIMRMVAIAMVMGPSLSVSFSLLYLLSLTSIPPIFFMFVDSFFQNQEQLIPAFKEGLRQDELCDRCETLLFQLEQELASICRDLRKIWRSLSIEGIVQRMMECIRNRV